MLQGANPLPGPSRRSSPRLHSHAHRREGSQMASSAHSDSGSDSDNTWDDWDDGNQPARSLFEPAAEFPTAWLALDHDRRTHGVDLPLIASTLGSSRQPAQGRRADALRPQTSLNGSASSTGSARPSVLLSSLVRATVLTPATLRRTRTRPRSAASTGTPPSSMTTSTSSPSSRTTHYSVSSLRSHADLSNVQLSRKRSRPQRSTLTPSLSTLLRRARVRPPPLPPVPPRQVLPSPRSTSLSLPLT